jgi:hypothetical protein
MSGTDTALMSIPAPNPMVRSAPPRMAMPPAAPVSSTSRPLAGDVDGSVDAGVELKAP